MPELKLTSASTPQTNMRIASLAPILEPDTLSNGCPKYMQRIAKMLRGGDFKFVSSTLSIVQKNTSSQLAVELAAEHINALKYPEEMLLAAASLASISQFAKNEADFLAYLEGVSAFRGDWEKRGGLVGLGVLTKNSAKYFKDPALAQNICDCTYMLANHLRTHTAYRFPRYITGVLAASGDFQYSSEMARLIKEILAEYLSKN